MIKSCYILLLLSLSVFSQEFQSTQVIDGWGSPLPPLILVLDAPAPPAISISRSTSFDSVLGLERDLEIIAEDGATNTVSFIHVSEEDFAFAAPAQQAGNVHVQYDGVDGSPDLNVNGLGSIDLTLDNADRFLLRMSCDVGATVELIVNSVDGGRSTVSFDVGRLEGFRDFYGIYDEFDGNADFSQVGSIELTIPFSNNLDITIVDFTVGTLIETESEPEPEPVDPIDPGCFEFVQPLEKEFIDYSLGCQRKQFLYTLGEPESGDSSSSSAGMLLPSIVLVVLSVLLM